MIDPQIEPRIWHIAAIVIVVGVLPQWTAFLVMPRMRQLPPDQQDRIRPRFYAEAMALQWALALIALSPLVLGIGTYQQLGLVVTVDTLPRVAAGAAIVGVLMWLLVLQRRNVTKHPDGRTLVRDAVQKYAWIIPKSAKQKRMWFAVSWHAGIGEELFFRGFLLAVLNFYLPLWAAMGAAILMFGLALTYQGIKGVVSTAFIGTVMMGLYVLTESLWVSIIAHAVYDVHGGRFAHWALYEPNDAPSHA